MYTARVVAAGLHTGHAGRVSPEGTRARATAAAAEHEHIGAAREAHHPVRALRPSSSSRLALHQGSALDSHAHERKCSGSDRDPRQC